MLRLISWSTLAGSPLYLLTQATLEQLRTKSPTERCQSTIDLHQVFSILTIDKKKKRMIRLYEQNRRNAKSVVEHAPLAITPVLSHFLYFCDLKNPSGQFQEHLIIQLIREMKKKRPDRGTPTYTQGTHTTYTQFVPLLFQSSECFMFDFLDI